MKKIFTWMMAMMAVVTVNAATYTLTMADYADTATNFTEGNFSLTCNKAGAQNPPVYNGTSFDVRNYANGEVVITCSDTISKLVFTTSAKGQQQQATIQPSTGSVAQTTGGTTIVWTGVATTLTLTVGATNDYGTLAETKGAGQFDFTAIEVTTGSNGGSSDGGAGNGDGNGGNGGNGGNTGGQTITINGLNYCDVFFWSFSELNDMIDMQLYADYDENDNVIFPYVYLEMDAKSTTSLVGSYDLYYGGYWPTENDSVVSNLESLIPVGTLVITYTDDAYHLHATWTGTDGNTYTFTCTPDLMVFDEYGEEMTIIENGHGGAQAGQLITVEQALAIGNQLADNATTAETYIVEGYVAKLAGTYNTQYGSQSFYMTDAPSDGTGYYDFEAYQCYLDAPGVALGDKVRVTGQILKYVGKNGSTTVEIKQGTVEIIRETALQEAMAGSKAKKVVSNGKVLIKKGATIYNAAGAAL